MENPMKARRLALVAGIVLATSLLGVAAVGATNTSESDAETELEATLSGLNEVAAGDPDGSGRVDVDVDVDGVEVCWKISVRDIATATAAHIHKEAIGVNGLVVIDFAGKLRGCTTMAAPLAAALAATPQDYYVNVHNPDFPGGAIRGQLRGEEADEVELQARLRGANEVTGGDGDGSGSFDADLAGTLICWKFRERNVAPITARHIHLGAAGVNGGVVVGFGNQARGCRDITAVLASAITANPSGYYTNIHNADHPGGALRGQLG